VEEPAAAVEEPATPVKPKRVRKPKEEATE